MSNYRLEISENQASILIKALDLYSRVCMGHWEEVISVYQDNAKCFDYEAKHSIRNYLSTLSSWATGLEPGAHFGIGSREIGDNPKIAYDMQQVIRHRLAWDKQPGGGITVNFDKPMQFCEEPLLTIEAINQNDKGKIE